MNHKKMLYIMALCASILVQESVSRQNYKTIRKDKDFYRVIKSGPFAVAMFTSLDKNEPFKDRALVQKSDFSAVSGDHFFEEGNVNFLTVDVKRRGLDVLAKSFNISRLPTFLLFKYNLPVRDDNDNLIALTGFSSGQNIKKFIDEYLGDDIEDYIDRVAQIRQERREQFEADQEYNRPSMYYGIGFGGGGGGYGGGGFAGNGFPACDYSWPYNTGYGYNCGNYGYFYGYPSFNFGVNVPL